MNFGQIFSPPPPAGPSIGHLPNVPPPNSGGTTAYPILTEELGYPPSPLAVTPGGAGPGASGGSSGSFGPTVSKALQDVLGWKIKPNDAKGFVGALNQSFQLATVEGSIVSTWTPRSYAVQTDLSGGVTGAQASVCTMANTLVERMLPLVDGLSPLNPASDLPDVAATKGLIKGQLTDLASEFGYLGGPRVMRVHQYFHMLLGVKLTLALPPPSGPGSPPPPATVKIASGKPKSSSPLTTLYPNNWPPSLEAWTDPDTALGSLGELRDLMGLYQDPRKSLINTVDDEQNVTNFRIIVDYASSLLATWKNNIQFFAGARSPFLGTQLVLISRQLGVISEVVDEVRFVLDSVLMGPSQRQSLLLDFSSVHQLPNISRVDPNGVLPPIYLEDLLTWIQDFVTVEAPPVIQEAGRLGLGADFMRMISELIDQSYALYAIAPGLGGGMSTGRVLQSIYKLLLRLNELYLTAEPVSTGYIAPLA
jgi:hypothetical protein